MRVSRWTRAPQAPDRCPAGHCGGGSRGTPHPRGRMRPQRRSRDSPGGCPRTSSHQRRRRPACSSDMSYQFAADPREFACTHAPSVPTRTPPLWSRGGPRSSSPTLPQPHRALGRRVVPRHGPGVRRCRTAALLGRAGEDRRRCPPRHPPRRPEQSGRRSESFVALLRGETVTKGTDWFALEETRLRLAPYQRHGIEVACASTVAPSGSVQAGTHGPRCSPSPPPTPDPRLGPSPGLRDPDADSPARAAKQPTRRRLCRRSACAHSRVHAGLRPHAPRAPHGIQRAPIADTK